MLHRFRWPTPKNTNQEPVFGDVPRLRMTDLGRPASYSKEERRRVAHEQLLRKTAVRNSLDALNKEYMPLLTDPDHQRQGYRLEKILRSLFEICDLDPRASFKIVGEQIDGAFSFETTDYLFDALLHKSSVRLRGTQTRLEG